MDSAGIHLEQQLIQFQEQLPLYTIDLIVRQIHNRKSPLLDLEQACCLVTLLMRSSRQ